MEPVHISATLARVMASINTKAEFAKSAIDAQHSAGQKTDGLIKNPTENAGQHTCIFGNELSKHGSNHICETVYVPDLCIVHGPAKSFIKGL